MDSLPQLANKVLVTKELTPIFRGREDELKENFATLTAVLDGKGFTSNSGVQRKRGYEQSIVFNWLGATTPYHGKPIASCIISEHVCSLRSALRRAE